jgi:hypothetical protein
MPKKKPPVFYFRTVSEMHAIPLEKIEAFTIDLKLWLQQHRIAELTGKGWLTVATPTDVFGWIDDGRHDVKVHLTVSEPTPADDAVDPSAASTGKPSTRA